jgi:hypothetical protein
MRNDVDVAFDRQAEHRARFVLVKCRKVGAASGQTDPVRCSGNDHWTRDVVLTPASVVVLRRTWNNKMTIYQRWISNVFENVR